MKKMGAILVDVEKFGFVAEPRYYYCGWAKAGKIKVRKSVVARLKQAKKLLPQGYNFKIWDGQRTLATQILLHQSFIKRVRQTHLKLSSKERSRLANIFSGGIVKNILRLDTHRHGGALDLTIVDRAGRELYMGTEFDEISLRSSLAYFEKVKILNNLDCIAKKNRLLLKKVMTKAGFINYSPEWWHWSYNK